MQDYQRVKMEAKFYGAQVAFGQVNATHMRDPTVDVAGS